ncbi:arsenite efflux transporter metallochaperone ArsD [Aquipuribacter sp. MA13-6]|uniref:arsenite efflux transporter metallochaperone ArsD n=1 Tax=unclassified Aquipuribacter TaxID=2635084 RepID=UPI003EF00E1B
MSNAPEDIRETVRARYAEAATSTSCCGSAPADLATDASGAAVFGAALYSGDDADEAALAGSLGCGVPTAVADLHPGETVLDLGSGSGGDVLLSARRVGPTGRAIGLDMTTEMLDLARANAAAAGVTNVEFVQGYLEDVPLPDDAVDVVISNCVLNLAADKTVVLREAARVLRPGGRLAFSDVVADEDMDEATKADMAAWTGCIAGALTESELRSALAAAGFVDLEVRPTHRVHSHAQAAVIRAVLPAAGTTGPEPVAPARSVVEVYDPAMCCSTGVCGPAVDPTLARFESDLRWLADQGVDVTRHNLAQDPGAFVAAPLVAAVLASGGEDALPVVMVDGRLRSSGSWLSREDLAAAVGLPAPGGPVVVGADLLPPTEACCAPADGPAAPPAGCC